ncbi:hypothetical protein Val02_63370 [Virgisporangium aliadipatigenens]|uniref:Peptidase M48 domain-containing protein n=1 Tax=Virgisporangium aliadipatigenens TaxID=741659 RepID=A0A8J4DTM4_9ACTN|nr:M48 family metalloprotease [Virgisporangium aliadipatigenens]GIJ49451.1 hypothetical protein Val02_63370 [Virgisporangium aliadipatigenens]
MTQVGVLAIGALVWPALVRACWPARAPRTAIAVWHLVTAGVAAAVVGLFPPALCAVLVLLLWGYGHRARGRRRHLRLLRLVARRSADGSLVVDHPGRLVYCLPGRAGGVVISAGALAALSAAELSAVLAHERAHLRERHDLALLPFAALGRLAPGAHAAVATLVEMCADDQAVRRHGRRAVRAALRRIAGGIPPQMGLAAASTGIPARLRRLDLPPRVLPVWVRALLLMSAVLYAFAPVASTYYGL